LVAKQSGPEQAVNGTNSEAVTGCLLHVMSPEGKSFNFFTLLGRTMYV
jgi:hypothetical protein